MDRFPTAQEIREICAKTACDDRTVRKVYRGIPVLSSSWSRVARAARELGHPEPPGLVRLIKPEGDR